MVTPLRLLGVLVLGGALLRFATLDVQSFWRDEASTVVDLRGGLAYTWERVRDLEGMPPLYFALAWPWAKVLGDGEVALRSLSALLGTLTIPIAWALARRLAASARADAAGLAAAALVAFNPFLIWYSQEARAYALLIGLCAAATWLFAVVAQEPGRRRALLGWGVTAALALGAHYFAAFLLVPQALVLLWRLRAAALRGVAIPLLAGLALIPLLVSQRDNGVDWVSETTLVSRTVDVAKHWVAGPFGTPADAAGALGILLLAGGAVVAVARGRGLAVAGVVAAALLFPIAFGLAGEDFVLDRYLAGALVPLLALAAVGFTEPPRALAAGAGALAVLFAAFTVATVADEERHREDWRAVADRVERRVATAVVVSRDGEPPMDVYLPAAGELQAPTAVQEVVVAASWRFGRARPATPPPPGRAFRLVSRTELATATVIRYAADEPQPVEPALLAGLTLDPAEPPAVLVRPATG